ncbi:hypothetical protein QBC42DRAFT_320849 [Cladorrhinum samala]|uniref:Uncharacterized protein n=1 Tax=Cladorrhinum samala TaxID=585594 RepID=A0AAV9HA16_9PEZI|nr:hypothetical protein QBC42DRAFT_320849 [Cladorrhinum samala]
MSSNAPNPNPNPNQGQGIAGQQVMNQQQGSGPMQVDNAVVQGSRGLPQQNQEAARPHKRSYHSMTDFERTMHFIERAERDVAETNLPKPALEPARINYRPGVFDEVLNNRTQILNQIPRSRVNYVHSHASFQIDVMDALNGETNWYTEDSKFRYHMRATIDNTQAVKNTIETILAKTHCHEFQITLQPIHRREAEKRRDTLQSAKRLRADRSQAPPAPEPTPVPGPGAAPGALDPKVCANCQKLGHELFQCAVPSRGAKFASIIGCPFCNTTVHTLDECPDMIKDPKTFNPLDRSLVIKVANKIWVDRLGNKPQIRSEYYNIFQMLESLANSDTPTLSKSTTVPGHGWPWSNEFSKRIATMSPTGNEFKTLFPNKIHPEFFDPNKHSFRDLPEDPKFAGKTLGEMVTMREAGQLNAEVYLSKETREKMRQKRPRRDARALARQGPAVPAAALANAQAATSSETGQVRIKIEEPEDGSWTNSPFGVAEYIQVDDNGASHKLGNVSGLFVNKIREQQLAEATQVPLPESDDADLLGDSVMADAGHPNPANNLEPLAKLDQFLDSMRPQR